MDGKVVKIGVINLIFTLAYILIFSLAWLSYELTVRPACQPAFECHYMCCPGFVTHRKENK